MSVNNTLLEQHMKIVSDLATRLEAIRDAAVMGASAEDILEMATGDLPMTDTQRQRDHFRLKASRLEGQLDSMTREMERWRELYRKLYEKGAGGVGASPEKEVDTLDNIEMRDHAMLIADAAIPKKT